MTRIPLFLVPAFAKPINKPFHLGVRAFSVTVCCEARHKNPRKDGRDSNKERGVSAMRSTGPRHRLGAQNRYKVLPEPRDLEEQKREAEIDLPFPEKHGLLGFFEKTQDKVQPVISELDEEDVGRWWKVNELQSKSFDDLHALHWKCLFEINRVKTRGRERARLRIPSAAEAAKTRLTSVIRTMSSIRKVLQIRQKAYEEAQVLLSQKSITQIEYETTRPRDTMP